MNEKFDCGNQINSETATEPKSMKNLNHVFFSRLFVIFLIIARERFQSSEDESLGSEQEAEAERELQRHTTMGTKL